MRSRRSRKGQSGVAAPELDHVQLAVRDLSAAGGVLEDRYGLASVEGGHHPGWGTANRIVPLGDAYLELVAVVDDDEAARNPFGRWVAGARAALVQPLGWALRTRGIDAVARRLGLTVLAGSRVDPNGRLLRWRLAGIEQAIATPSLPFFIEWGRGTPHPGRAPATHPAGTVKITRLELDGDATRIETWLDGHRLPITVRPGVPALTSVTLTHPAGEITLDAGLR
jgi:Glyoxalase-like domain